MPHPEFVWWIEPLERTVTDMETGAEYNFALCREHAGGQVIKFLCCNMVEAHGKLNAIAEEALRSDHTIGIA
jgi:hypothetical protein